MSVLLRGLVAIVAVAVAGWLGVQAVGAHGDAEVTRITLSERTPSAQQRARASMLSDRMERLNPDERPEQLRGLVGLPRRRHAARDRDLPRDRPPRAGEPPGVGAALARRGAATTRRWPRRRVSARASWRRPCPRPDRAVSSGDATRETR